MWKDPNFEPKQKAFYYERVLKNPMPRWTANDAKVYAVTHPKDALMRTLERAYV
ncbi:DUF3604 domain-containing protein [Dasania marina]|uniref:DUF3604 domain-containing protein n=1 Tax=Dasania marina TaxID=471499 RepID=UPI0030DDBD1E